MSTPLTDNIDWEQNPPRIVYHKNLGLWELLFGKYGGGYYQTEEEVRFEYDRAVKEIAEGTFIFRRYRDRETIVKKGRPGPSGKLNLDSSYFEIPPDALD